MRGRLIFKFLAEIYRLDTSTSATNYDDDFKESVKTDTQCIRNKHPPIRIPCQVEDKLFEEMQLLASGHVPRTRVDLVFHFRDLERLELIDDAGQARIRIGDRLSAIYDVTGSLVQQMRSPLYVTEARPIGFGLDLLNPSRNLLLVTFEPRASGTRR